MGFYAEPIDEEELPKSGPDYYSTGTTFISVDELDKIRLRADEPKEWFMSLTDSLMYHPLDILSCWKHDHRTVANDNVKQNVPTSTTKGTNIFIPIDAMDEDDDDDEPIPISAQLTGDTPLALDDDDTFANEHILTADELKKMVTRSPT